MSIRTVQRDIDSLCQSGIPIVADTGAGGGYYLAESFCMDAHTATNGKITCEYDNGECDMMFYVIENEHFWFGTLLSPGDGIEITAPEHIRHRVLEAAKKIVLLYQKL